VKGVKGDSSARLQANSKLTQENSSGGDQRIPPGALENPDLISGLILVRQPTLEIVIDIF
jgi:hypothetical protein